MVELMSAKKGQGEVVEDVQDFPHGPELGDECNDNDNHLKNNCWRQCRQKENRLATHEGAMCARRDRQRDETEDLLKEVI